MRSVIRQSVVLPAPFEELFDSWLDPARHAAITGSPVVVGATPGSAFRAFDGALTGHIVEAARPRLIVQSWRSTKFTEADADSTLILLFGEADGGGRIDLFHLDVPPHDEQGVREGWPNFYWTPWRRWLETGS